MKEAAAFFREHAGAVMIQADVRTPVRMLNFGLAGAAHVG
jgi:hypothetical protein